MEKVKKDSKRYAILFILLFAVLIPSIFADEVYPEAVLPGEPVFTTEYSDFRKLSIDQILTVDDTVYVLYDNHRGIIQVFDSNGTYLYTVTFFKHQNGAFSMAACDGILYVKDCHSNIYSLKDGTMLSFHDRESAPMWMRQLDYRFSSIDYRIRYGSVWRITDETEYCFIARPIVSVLYQNDLFFYFSRIAVLLLLLLKIHKKDR